MRWLEDLLARLEPGSRVLDIGCASGVPVASRISGAHEVVGVDLSSVQVDEARTNVPAGTFICGDILEVEFAARHFDAVVCFYSIDHIPRRQHATVLKRIHGWLRPGGLLLLSVEDDDQPGRSADWLGAPMYFSHYDAETTERLVAGTGFLVLQAEVETQMEGEVEVPYLFLLAQKD